MYAGAQHVRALLEARVSMYDCVRMLVCVFQYGPLGNGSFSSGHLISSLILFIVRDDLTICG